MATMKLKGFEEYERKISQMSNALKKDIVGAALYAGADVVADAVRASIQALPIVHGYGTAEHPLPGGVTAAQKVGLLEGFGISKARDDNGFHNVKLGFDGYNTMRTDKFPSGQPNQLVARGVESGTSWKRKRPFVRPAVNKVRDAAVQKMAQVVDDSCAKIMK